MARLISFCCLSVILLAVSCQGVTLDKYFCPAAREHIKQLLSSPKASGDAASAHYAALGLSLLGEKLEANGPICATLKKADQTTLEGIYHSVVGSKVVPGCQLALSAPAKNLVTAALAKADAGVAELFYAVSVAKASNIAVDATKAAKTLAAAIQKEDSIVNQGMAFETAVLLNNANAVAPIVAKIEESIQQADEVNGVHLQFEGGLSVTAQIIANAYRLGDLTKKPIKISPEQAGKFAKYLLSRTRTQNVRGAALLIDALKVLSSNKQHVPVVFTTVSGRSLSARAQTVVVRVTDVLGQPIGTSPLTVVLDKAVRVLDKVTVDERKPFQPSKEAKTDYVMNFMASKPKRGFYTFFVSATPSAADARLVGNKGAEISIKVTTLVDPTNVRVGTVDRDQTSEAQLMPVPAGGKLPHQLDVDFHQKLLVKFNIKDKTHGDMMTVQQAFVRLRSATDASREIIYVAEHDSNLLYQFDLDVSTAAKDFSSLSGVYDLQLVLGDAVLPTASEITLGQVKLTFASAPEVASEESIYKPKPEITHMFRPKDKRAPKTVAMAFTGLVLAPLGLLLILWLAIGINFKNFPISLSSVVFFIGLGGIFSLYACFWLKLDMFQTMKYLIGLGIITFISGHSMLAKLTSLNQPKQNNN